MRTLITTGILFQLLSFNVLSEDEPLANPLERPAPASSTLNAKQWIHGSDNCRENTDSAIDVYVHDPESFIFRQNKCLSFEAPFIYVLVGEHRIFILDTGDSDDPSEFPLYSLIQSVAGGDTLAGKEILVAHSHSHRDHYRGDAQFKGKQNVTVVSPAGDDMKRFFGFSEWPSDQASVELGGRTLTVIATPGHQEEAISIYDPQTGWLLTGDTLYPGVIYVKHWEDYKSSIARLTSFSNSHEISAILGAHIEMTREAGKHYEIGTTYQPEEAPLDLEPAVLAELNYEFEKSGKKRKLVFDEFIIEPMGRLQKTMSNLGRWISQ